MKLYYKYLLSDVADGDSLMLMTHPSGNTGRQG